MNGRELFKKYSNLIDLLSKWTAKLPKRYRSHRLDTLRNKPCSLAMLRRYLLVKSLANKCGSNVAIFPGVYLFNIENLEIGENVSIHEMCYIDAEGGISIENNVSIAHRSTVLSSNHIYSELDTPIKYQGMKLEKTVIKQNVWIGCGCSIMAGVTINSGSVVGANSTVTKDVPKNTIAGGSPAKVFKTRNGKEIGCNDNL